MLQAKPRLAGICRSCFRFEEFKGLSIARPSHEIWGLEVRNLSGASFPFRRPTRYVRPRNFPRLGLFEKSRRELASRPLCWRPHASLRRRCGSWGTAAQRYCLRTFFGAGAARLARRDPSCARRAALFLRSFLLSRQNCATYTALTSSKAAILFRKWVVPLRSAERKRASLEKVVPAPLHRGLTARSIS